MAPEKATDDVYGELREHLTEPELVEVGFAVMVFSGLHRFNTAVDLEPPPGGKVS